MEKVEKDVGAIRFILSSIKEVEVKTDMLINDQGRDVIHLRDIHKNFKLFTIIMNRFDKNSPA